MPARSASRLPRHRLGATPELLQLLATSRAPGRAGDVSAFERERFEPWGTLLRSASPQGPGLPDERPP